MKTCIVDGCDKAFLANGWCSMHYTRWKKYGDPLTVRQPQHHGLTLNERLDVRTDKTGDCWEWTGARTSAGYGLLNVDGKPQYVHRLSFTRHTGRKLWSWHVICHRCDNPKCLNPEHLILGNQHTNVADMWSKGRARPGTTHGVNHPRAKLAEDDVLAIRASSLSQDKLAAQYGVAQATVHAIIARKTWRHI